MKLRTPKKTDFIVPVEDVGDFTFARRTMEDEFMIAREYSRVIGDIEHPSWYLNMLASCVSPLRVLTVKAPEGWDLDTLDPLQEETFQGLTKVATALREAEERFRRGTGSAGEGVGSQAGQLD